MQQKQFHLENGTWSKPVDKAVPIDLSWGENYRHDSSVLLDLPGDFEAYVFIDRRLTAGSAEEIRSGFAADGVVAHMVSCDGYHWRAVNEPLGNNEFGLTILTEAGKAIIAGYGRVNADGSWAATLSHLYPGIRNKRSVSFGGGIKGGTHQPTTIEGTLTFGY